MCPMQDSNLRPLACKSGALPTELTGLTFAHKTIAHKTVAHKTIAHKTIAHNLNEK